MQKFLKDYETNKSEHETQKNEINTLRDKNRELHEKNQKYLEKNSQLMEAQFTSNRNFEVLDAIHQQILAFSFRCVLSYLFWRPWPETCHK